MRSVYVCLGAASVCALAVFASAQKPPQAPATKKSGYAMVKPIFDASCVGCHHGAKAAHGLDLSTYALVVKGDKEGKVIVSGQPTKSRLAMALHGKPELMPPDKALAKDKIAVIEAWIKAGAKEK